MRTIYIFMIEWVNFSFRMMIVSRFYSIIRLYLDILTWKGVFGIFDNVVDHFGWDYADDIHDETIMQKELESQQF